MKFIIALAALIAVAVAAPTGNDDKQGFRNEFDHLLLITAEEKFRELEKFLLHLSEEVTKLEETKDKELKEQILREITVSENFAKGAKEFFEREAKRSDLDLVEKFNYDAAVISADILIKDLNKLSAQVMSIH